MLQIAIPAVGFLVGLLLYRKRPTVYIAYSLWVWVLIPLIRRIVDYNFGWHNQSLILLTPHLVTSVSVLDFTRSRDKTIGAIPVSILLCLGGVLYGLAIGLLLHPSAELALGLLNWITPLLFGAHLARDWTHYEPHRAARLPMIRPCWAEMRQRSTMRTPSSAAQGQAAQSATMGQQVSSKHSCTVFLRYMNASLQSSAEG